MADGKGEVIHNTCPCCEVPRPPHCDDCTFAVDCPEACADFDYVANLRLTDEEREAIEAAAGDYLYHQDAGGRAQHIRDTLLGLLERTK